MSKVIMGNGGFTGCMIEAQGVSACRRKKQKPVYSYFLLPPFSTPWTLIKQRQTPTTHNTNRHFRVRFYTFVGQPLSKQQYRLLFFVHNNPRNKRKAYLSHEAVPDG